MSKSENQYPAVILAAGRSERMGFPKLLMSQNGRLAARRLVDDLMLSGWDRAGIVISDESLQSVLEAEIEGTDIIFNAQPETGMIDSLRLALDWSGEAAKGLLALPIDHPLVSRETLAAIRAEAKSGLVAIPTHQGRRGHPTWWGRDSWPALRSQEADHGARHILRHPAIKVVELPVTDPAVLINIDTPEDATRWRLTKFEASF